MMGELWSEELAYRIALQSIYGVGATAVRALISRYGSARQVFDAPFNDLFSIVSPRHRSSLVNGFQQRPKLLERAYREIDFMQEHHIRPLLFDEADFPKRLNECCDAPSLLYQMGTAKLDAPHVLSIVGTRRSTQYGRDCVNSLAAELHEIRPDVLIVSGLAVGIDGIAHRAALDHGFDTVGVLAHGLDTMYPAEHRALACEMLQHGGLLTEYCSATHIDRGNFLARNRIIAGLADVTLVAESRETGGALVTAKIAQSYNREVCAFPGRINDDRSKGCNRLIVRCQAAMITSAQDLLDFMGWKKADAKATASKQRELPFGGDGTNEEAGGKEQQIVEYLTTHGSANIMDLTSQLDVEASQLHVLLLQLEMANKVRMVGGRYQLR